MPEDPDKRIVIIAGPNGAGKTTFAREYLSNEAAGLDFLNADELCDNPSNAGCKERGERSHFGGVLNRARWEGYG